MSEIQRSSHDWTDRPVYRRRPLPRGELRGLFLVCEPVISETRNALTSFALAGIDDCGHEGIVYWTGRESTDCTVFLQAIVPVADHSHGRVMVNREEIGRTQRAARAQKLGVLCQVHSHPGGDARHSDGDDDLVLLPFEGMLSIVVPRFGIGFSNVADACVHQFQDGRWVLCSPESLAKQLIVVSTVQDLR
jgi:proteasome lid subunit RPN8/RPN11